MARKRFSDEDVIRLLRQIEVELASGARSLAGWGHPKSNNEGIREREAATP